MSTDQNDINLQDSMFRRYARHQAGNMKENIQALQIFIQLWRMLVWLMSYPGYILMRYNFGERFLTIRIIITSYFLCMFVALAAQSKNGTLLGVAILLAGCVHRLQIFRRNRRQESWHSYDPGTSFLARKFPDQAQKIESYAEPLLVMTLGVLIAVSDGDAGLITESPISFLASGAFGIYVLLVGLAMRLQASKLKRDARNLYLDARDSQIDNMAMAQMQERDMQAVEIETMHAQSGIAQAV